MGKRNHILLNSKYNGKNRERTFHKTGEIMKYYYYFVVQLVQSCIPAIGIQQRYDIYRSLSIVSTKKKKNSILILNAFLRINDRK